MGARAPERLDPLRLARKLERLSARSVARLVEKGLGDTAQCVPVGDGTMAFMSPGSPLNHVVGLGMTARVSEETIESIERFYAERGERALIALCEHADPHLAPLLHKRGWEWEGRGEGRENVLVRPFSAGDEFKVPDGVEIREALDDEERDTWALVAATGFSAPFQPLREQLEVAAAAAASPHSRLFLGYLEGSVAGAAELAISDGVAWLSADTTLPAFRCRGVQTALQAHRLDAGFESGCEMAVSEAAPDSQSQRNMERFGFVPVYERIDVMGPVRRRMGSFRTRK